MKKSLRVAVLDLNNNVQNRGIPYIRRMIESYGDLLTYDVFDVRHKLEIPDLNYDIYVSSGGPGSPFDFEGGWDKGYFNLISLLESYNRDPSVSRKKYVFFICHSFQLACQHFKTGTIKRRVTRSFGTFPCFLTEDGNKETIFNGLPNPFWIADFRDWQVVNADKMQLEEQGFKILALEKDRPHINLPRAIMAMRFTNEMLGTQFHPEADAEGMYSYFNDPERKAQVTKDYGEERYLEMLNHLKDEDKINLTHKTILPNFLTSAIEKLSLQI